MKIDHFMWACSDLNAGIEFIANLTGVEAIKSGAHPGQGTCNALLSLGDSCYLEIIAPDTEQSLESNLGGRLVSLPEPGLLSWAIRTENLHNLWVDLSAKHYRPGKVQDSSRKNADGELLEWQLMFLRDVSASAFFIDWLDCQHPALTSPKGCDLMNFELTTPDAQSHRSLWGDLSQFTLIQGEKVSMRLVINTPKGEIRLGEVEPFFSLL